METPEIAAPRQTLAMRMAERRRLRAERLAHLAPARAEGEPESRPERGIERSAAPAAPAAVPAIAAERDAAAALEEFLRSLTRGLAGELPAAAGSSCPIPAAVLPFQRSAPAEDRGCDLARLAGVGPGLVWALRRAGIPDLRSLARLEPEALAARLGPLGRLVPARAWIETARSMPDRR